MLNGRKVTLPAPFRNEFAERAVQLQVGGTN
jgi:hypothetical protein